MSVRVRVPPELQIKNKMRFVITAITFILALFALDSNDELNSGIKHDMVHSIIDGLVLLVVSIIFYFNNNKKD